MRNHHGVELTDDGLDESGLALRRGARIPYVRGSEAAIGEFKPISLGAATANLLDRDRAGREIGESTESPIELQLGAAIIMCFERAGTPLKLCLELPKDRPEGLLLVPQFKWSHYRSDWAIVNPRQGGALLIECDGRDFHSSSEQRAHDRKKDAAAHDRGYLTIRFDGSSIFMQADECAKKIYDVIFAGADSENV